MSNQIAKCVICGKTFEKNKPKSITCGSDCYKQLQVIKKIKESQEKFTDPDEYVECEICGLRATMLNSAHFIKKHNMTIAQYRERYNDAPVISKKASREMAERVKGDKNPAYQHGGKFSPYSDKFVKYDNLSDEEKQHNIDKMYEKANKTREENPQNSSVKIEYWLEKGYSLEEAKQKLSERQTTFSLEICVERYGEEKGLAVWKKRQEKWQQTLEDKSDEEKIEILKKKMTSKSSVSKVELEVYESIRQMSDLEVEEQFVVLGGDLHGNWIYDFKIGNYLIEFNGDYIHCNPRMYASEFYNKVKGKYAKELWELDKRKAQAARHFGYEFITIWERDYNQDKEGVIKNLIETVTSHK